MRKKPIRKLLVACIAGALFLPGKGFTLGLGEIEVNSGLNQQLNADVALLSAAPEDTQNLIVKLASRKEFSRAGLDRPFLLNQLHFKTVIVNNVPHIKITTDTPVREPFLNFLLEVDWPKGHLLREYTVLLDPPAFMTQGSVAPAQTRSSDIASSRPSGNTAARPSPTVVTVPATVNPSVSSRPTSSGPTSTRPTSTRPTSTRPTSTRPTGNQAGVTAAATIETQNAVIAAQTTIPEQASNRYRIHSGDTAWSLAKSLRPNQSVSVEQMMIALLRANPDSFIKNNINGLKRGYILRLPDTADISTISAAEARAVVKQQTALWRKYRQTNAGGQAVNTANNQPVSSAAETQSSSAQANRNNAQLKIISAGSGESTSGTKDPTSMNATELRAALAVSREKLETERVEKESLQQQVDMLEGQLQTEKGAVAVENNGLADAQAQAQGATETSPVAAQAPAAVTTEQNAEATPATEAPLTNETAPATATAAQESATEKPVFVDETTTSANQTATETQTPANNKAVEPAPAPVVPPKSIDPLTKLLNEPMLMAAAGGGLLLLLALIYLVMKRRKSVAPEGESIDTDDSTSTSLEDVADMVEDDQLEESDDVDTAETDTESTMILDAANVTETGDEKSAEEEPRDDVIAEADVYLAYGIFQQAQDLLENAIKEDPERDDYRVKLAETHYASKDKDAFIDVATELKQRTGNEDTAAWRKVVAMGQDMCAEHVLFQGSLVGGLDVDALGPKSPAPMDFDLGINADDDTGPEVDSADANAVNDLSDLELPDIEETPVENLDENEALADARVELENNNDLEFELGETNALAEDELAKDEDDQTLEEEFSLDIDASELDIDNDSVTDVPKAETDELELDLSADDMMGEPGAETHENLNPDLDDNSTEAVSIDDAAASNEINLDLSDEELDKVLADEDVSAEMPEPDDEKAIEITEEDESIETLTTAVELEAEAENSQAISDDDIDDEFDLSSLDDVDEISTKLDLARAYLDMGDQEGTKEILQEVLADGNDTQKAEANELLSQLGNE